MSSPATPVVVRQNSPDLGGGDSPVCMTPLMVTTTGRFAASAPIEATPSSSCPTGSSPFSPPSPSDPCSICTISLGVGALCELPCGHRFHKTCIRAHAEHNGGPTSAGCPYCRSTFTYNGSPFSNLQRVAPEPETGSEWYSVTMSSQIMHRTNAARMAVQRALDRMREERRRLVPGGETLAASG